jgi:hypothetical protein
VEHLAKAIERAFADQVEPATSEALTCGHGDGWRLGDGDEYLRRAIVCPFRAFRFLPAG